MEETSGAAGDWAGFARSVRGPLVAAALFSAAVNLLMLTGPIFMLQVYDRVLPAHAPETLAALFLIALAAFGVQAPLDLARGRVMARIAARMQARLEAPLAAPLFSGDENVEKAAARLAALDAVQRGIAAPFSSAALDLPWTPIFLGATFLLHPLLGWLSLSGAVLLAAGASVQTRFGRAASASAARTSADADRIAREAALAQDTVRSLGMGPALRARWQDCRRRSRAEAVRHAGRTALTSVGIRSGRLVLQSSLLALGAALALRGEISLGAMAASSILMGRALAPVEGLVSHWTTGRAALEGLRLLRRTSWEPLAPEVGAVRLPPPRGRFDLSEITLSAPETSRAILSDISFSVPAGCVLGIIGPSGSGKSTLLATLAGIVAPTRGTVRLDGAHIAHYRRPDLATAMGVLPQQIALFPGTVGENIARMAQDFDSAAVIAAARRAGLHERVTTLPAGYETRLEPRRPALSGGEMQRLALARALFGDPAILILDEPDAALDAEGVAALLELLSAHRARGGTAILASHRPTVLQACDTILSLAGGRVRAFGPREDVLAFRQPASDAIGQRLAVLRPVGGRA